MPQIIRYSVGERVELSRKMQELGWPREGMIEAIDRNETFPYLVRFDDGRVTSLADPQIAWCTQLGPNSYARS
jgi:hypothetical protein